MRSDIYDLWVGDVFTEVSPWGDSRQMNFQVVRKKEKKVFARDLATGRVVPFFYSDEIYAPRVYLVTKVNTFDRQEGPKN